MLDIDRKVTACFSGHRTIDSGILRDIDDRLTYEIVHRIGEGYRNFICGGALGFDTMAAKAVLDIRAARPYIRLILALPHKGRERRWSVSDKLIYNQIMLNADEIMFISEDYYNGCMLARNRFMVDNSNLLIAYCKESTGGTAYTYKYAVKCGIKRVNLSY